MHRFLDAIRAHASAMDGDAGRPRWGVVQTVDPVRHLARVLLQPEGVLTGWLPVCMPMVGSGWGLSAPPVSGQQVVVIADLGDADHGVILGGAYSTANMPASVPATPGAAATPAQPGEVLLAHSTGSYLRLGADGSVFVVSHGDLNAQVGGNLSAAVTGNASLTVAGGSIDVTATTTTLHGNLIVTGDIFDLNAAHASLGTLRADYDAHTHVVPNVQTGGADVTTTTPTPQDT